MKRYFLTSSLNVDNILSTESISPLTTYPKRTFGYQSFEAIDNRIPKVYTLLLSSIPDFVIEDDGRENFPVVVEIDDDKQLASAEDLGEYGGIRLYGISNTVYLSPINCKFFFFSKKAAVLTRQNCLDSKLDKWGEYFEFNVTSPVEITLDMVLDAVNLPKRLMASDSWDENLYDKTKGFIYGYYLGMAKSISPRMGQVTDDPKKNLRHCCINQE